MQYIGAALTALGLGLWFAPWHHWPPAALRCAVPGLAFLSLGLVEAVGAGQPAALGASYVLIFVWVGLSQPRGTPSVVAVPAAAVYVGSLLIADASAAEMASSVFVLLVGVIAGEACAWLTQRQREAETSRQSATAAVEQLLHVSTRLARAATEPEAADIAAEVTENLLGADLVVVMVREAPGSTRFRLVTDRRLPFDPSEFVIDPGSEPSAVGEVVTGGEPLFVADICNSPVASARLGRRLGVASAGFFPLPGEGGHFGALVAMWFEPRPALQPVIMRTAAAIASDAGLALERTRALARSLEELDRLTTAQTALRRSEARSRQLIATAGEPFVSIGVDGRVIEWNREAEKRFGWERDEVMGRPLVDLIVPEHLRSLHNEGLRRFRDSGEGGLIGRTVRLEAVSRSGETFPVELTVWSATVEGTVTFNAFIRDISQQERFEAELTRQALHDPLTGLPNRLLLADRLHHALSDCRHGGTVTVLFLDIDGFKTVNDSLGHSAGDRLLVSMAARLSGLLRPADTVARISGDEFAVVLEDTPLGGGVAVAERIQEALTGPHQLDGHTVFISASIGIAAADPGQVTADDLLRNADLAMYVAKRRGRGNHAVFEIGMHEAALRRLELEADLRRALHRSELSLHYQPVVRLADGSIIGMEALLRWRRDGEWVPPSLFIPVAEDSGLIIEIGSFVLAEACRQAQDWHRRLGASIHLSVNVSGVQLQRTGFPERVAHVLRSTGFPAGKLVLELTESYLMEDRDNAASILKDLKRLGVMVAIDDFGTAYSSLARLQTFPIDLLKVDRSFVTGLLGGPEEAALAHAIVKLGHTLGLKTIAEGIEEAAQRDTLHAIGCEFGQGYLFSRPLPTDAMADLLSCNMPLWEPGRAS